MRGACGAHRRCCAAERQGRRRSSTRNDGVNFFPHISRVFSPAEPPFGSKKFEISPSCELFFASFGAGEQENMVKFEELPIGHLNPMNIRQ